MLDNIPVVFDDSLPLISIDDMCANLDKLNFDDDNNNNEQEKEKSSELDACNQSTNLDLLKQ